jgi:hypothetical protein
MICMIPGGISMNDIVRLPHTHDEDDIDGCGCGRELAEADAVSDADLPPARGGVETSGTHHPVKEGVA